MNAQNYNGWKNRQTWNIALWLQNDEGLYRRAQTFMSHYKGRTPYTAFVRAERIPGTPDGVSFTDAALSLRELNGLLYDIKFGR
jgi:hypothetical protein